MGPSGLQRTVIEHLHPFRIGQVQRELTGIGLQVDPGASAVIWTGSWRSWPGLITESPVPQRQGAA